MKDITPHIKADAFDALLGVLEESGYAVDITEGDDTELERILRMLRHDESAALMRGDEARARYAAELAQRLTAREHYR